MKSLVLCTFICLVTSSTAKAQQWVPWNNFLGATPQSAWLHGQADLVRSQGLYWNLYGDYLIDRETARRLHIKNDTYAVQEYFNRKKINKAERFEPPLAAQERHLNIAFKKLELELKEIELIKKQREVHQIKEEMGLIKEPQIIVKGKTFHSIEEFRESPEYHQIKRESLERRTLAATEKTLEEERHWESVKFSAWWDNLSWSAKRKYIERKNAVKLLRSP